MVEVLADYSKRARFKLDELSTVRDALDRIDAGKIRRPHARIHHPSQRYRLTDRFTPDELNQLVARYQAGEMSAALAKESGIAKSTFLRLLAERSVRARVTQANGRTGREDPAAPQGGGDDPHHREASWL